MTIGELTIMRPTILLTPISSMDQKSTWYTFFHNFSFPFYEGYLSMDDCE